MSMIYGFRAADRFVYHYTGAAVARDYILKNRTLKLGSYTRTNDPKESKAWEFDLWTNQNRHLGNYKMQELSSWFSAALKANAKLACFSLDSSPLSGDHTRDILSRGFAKPRMWAQYAENHSGVCLVFDRSKLLEAVHSQLGALIHFAGPVTYQNHYLVRPLTAHEYSINIDQLETLGPQGYLQSHVRLHHKALFFEKLLDWRDEVEWRILVLSDSDADLLVPIDDALVGIVHGASINRTISDDILQASDSTSIEHMGLTWKNSNPWYDLGSFRWSAANRASPWFKHERGA
jgi:hypothetical protein